MASIAEILQWAEHEDVRLSTHNGRLSVGDNRPEGHSAALSEAITANRLALIDWLQAHAKPVTPPVTPVLNGHAPPATPKQPKTLKSSATTREVALTERYELENILHDVLMGTMEPTQSAVLAYLARHTLGFNKLATDELSLKHFSDGDKTKDGVWLNRGAGVSLSSAKRALTYLEERGLITRKRRNTKFGDKDATVYAIVADAWRGEWEAMKQAQTLPPAAAQEPKRGRPTVSQRRSTQSQPRPTVDRGLVHTEPTGRPTVSQPLYKENKRTYQTKVTRERGTSRAARDPTTTHPP